MGIRNYFAENTIIDSIEEFIFYKIPIIIYSPIYYIGTWLFSKIVNEKKYKYKASLCLIFKDEARYLKEWIDYHILIGIDHFYLYNNNSTDNYLEILKPYIENGVITLINFPKNYAQVKAYQDCYERSKLETEWLGYIDVDEYINLIKHNSIKELLNSVRQYPSLYLNWRMFGTSGFLKETAGTLTIERYTQCWKNLCPTGKCFINNRYPKHKIWIHYHRNYFFGVPVAGVATNKSIAYKFHYLYSANVDKIAYINHYWSRSYEFYIYKNHVKTDVSQAKHEQLKKNHNNFKLNELNNISKDFSILRWLIFLKKDIGISD